MDWDKVPKSVFEATELPRAKRNKDGTVELVPFVERNAVGERERLAFFRNIATSIECQGSVKGIRKEALDLLAQQAKGIEVQGFPDKDSLMWKQYARQFGKWKVFCTFWEGKLVVNMLHIFANETVYWQRYQFKGVTWFVQNDGSKRITGTKCNRHEFFAWMIKRCNHHIEEFLLTEIYGFVASDKCADTLDKS